MIDLWNNKLYQKELDNTEISKNIWNALYGKSILITGANGMVCSFLVDVVMRKNQFLNAKEKINLILPVRNLKYAQERFAAHVESDYFQLIELDVTDIDDELDEVPFQYVIVGAGNADPKSFSEFPVDTIKSNFMGILNLLEIVKNRRGVRVLYISSGEVYGNGGNAVEAFKESDAYYINSTDVRACYPNSKRVAETLCVAYYKQYGIETIIGRLCYVYGPTIKDTDSRSVAQFLRHAARREDIVLKSKGEQVRSYCYVADAVSAILFLLVNGKSGEAYNIANENSNISIAEFAKILTQVAKVKCTYELPSELEKCGYSKVERAVQSPQKIKDLGWESRHLHEKDLEVCMMIMRDSKDVTS